MARKSLIAAVALLLLCLLAAVCSALTGAACRVTSGRNVGSGCCYEVRDGYAYVLSVAHNVPGHGPDVAVEFLAAGKAPAEVLRRDAARDVLTLRVPLAKLRARPNALPLAPADWCPTPGEPLYSIGWPYGEGPRTFTARAVGTFSGRLKNGGREIPLAALQFRPTAELGRSGAALVDAKGRIVGLIRMQLGNRPVEPLAAKDGLAVPVTHLWTAAYDCRDGLCVPREGRAGVEWRGPRGAEFKAGREWSAGTGPPPTVPLPQPTPAPRVDLAPLEQRLDVQTEVLNRGLAQIADLLDDRLPLTPEPIPPTIPIVVPDLVPEPEPKPSPAIDADAIAAQAAQEAARAASEAAGAAVEQKTSRTRELLEGLRTELRGLAGDRETLRARIEERLAGIRLELGADAPTPEILRAYARDVLDEKLADGSLGMSAGKLAAGALGLSGPVGLGLVGAGWLIGRRLRRRIRRKRNPDGTVEEVEENP